jgi:triacylglycerol lipase
MINTCKGGGQACGPAALPFMPHGEVPYPAPIFSEALCALEFLALRLSPAYFGMKVPRGDGSAVVIIPGLLGTDLSLFELYAWLERIGYRAYYSGMGLGAGCPDRLARQLDETIDRAYEETGRRVHLIGHSLGGIFARSAAARRPKRVASVITLGSPFRGLEVHGLVLAVIGALRKWIQVASPGVRTECGTSRCHCGFGRSLGKRWPRSVRQTAMYTKCDGIVNWRYCVSGKPDIDVEVGGTHLGLPFNTRVFGQIAARLNKETEIRSQESE